MKESACFQHVRCDFDCKGAHAMEPWSRASYGAYAFHAADWGLGSMPSCAKPLPFWGIVGRERIAADHAKTKEHYGYLSP